MLLEADWIWTRPGALLRGGGLWLDGGRVRAVLESPRQVAAVAERGGERVHLGAWLLMPAWVNAHAHLDLTFLRGRLAPGPDFGGWVRAVLEARATTAASEVSRAIAEGLGWCLAGGAAAVCDIVGGEDEAAGAPRSDAGDAPLRVSLSEVLDGGDPRRTGAQLKRLERMGSAGGAWGISPHAPHTCSPELLAACARRASAGQVPVQTHWAETADEVAYLGGRDSVFDGMLPHVDRGTTGLERLEAAGLLGARTSLVHGNFAEADDWERVARAGATLVHCPGTHAFFERGPTPVEAALGAGVRVALGTDSAASNASLDLPHEVAGLLATHPRLGAAEALEMVTVHASKALGLDAERGRLAPGAPADLFAVQLEAADGVGPGERALEAALREPERGRRVFLAGRPVRPWGSEGAAAEDPAWSWSGAEVAARWAQGEA